MPPRALPLPLRLFTAFSVAVHAGGAAATTTIVDLADNSVTGDCTQSGRCNLDAALRLHVQGPQRIELHVDCDAPGDSVVPAGADVSIVGLVGGEPKLAQENAGQENTDLPKQRASAGPWRGVSDSHTQWHALAHQ